MLLLSSAVSLKSGSIGWDPDQDRQIVGPDLGPNYLQRLWEDDSQYTVKIRFGPHVEMGGFLHLCIKFFGKH